MDTARTFAPESAQMTRFGPRFESDCARAPAVVAAVENAPDDLEALRAYDRFFFELGQLDAIVARWTSYLARHPTDGRALMERCGTYSHLRRYEEAANDCAAACRIAGDTVCVPAQRLRENARRSAEEAARHPPQP